MRRGCGDEGLERDVGLGDLFGEVLVAAGEAAPHGLGGVLGFPKSPVGRNLAQVVISAVVLKWRSCSRSWAGAVISKALSWLVAWVRVLTAPLRATRSARIASTRPSRVLGWPARGRTRQSGSGRCIRVQRVGFSLRSARCAVGPVDLYHSYTGSTQVPDEPGTVGTCAFYPDALELTVPIQPGA